MDFLHLLPVSPAFESGSFCFLKPFPPTASFLVVLQPLVLVSLSPLCVPFASLVIAYVPLYLVVFVRCLSAVLSSIRGHFCTQSLARRIMSLTQSHLSPAQ
jgi:hypothetical protein